MNWSMIKDRLIEDERRLKKEIENDKYYTLLQKIKSLRFSQSIFFDNLSDFYKWNDEENIPQFTFPMNDKYKEETNDFLRKTTRLFINSLSSGIMYVDHSITVKNKICKEFPDFKKVYRKKVSQPPSESTVFNFVKELRVYALHIRSVNFILNTKFASPIKPYDSINSIIFNLSNLRKWSKWNEKSQKYLAKLDEKTSMYTTLSDFTEVLKESYISFHNTYIDYFENELKKIEIVILRFNKIHLVLDNLTEHIHRIAKIKKTDQPINK